MAKIYNRAWMSTATIGTGTITLGAAQNGYFTFAEAGVVNADVVSYTIIDGTEFEIGIGTYTSAGTTLTRTVTASKVAGVAGTTKITLTGNATVFISARSQDFLPGFTDLADPNADRIIFWDDSAGIATFLVASTGLTITTTNLLIDTAVVALIATEDQALTGGARITTKDLGNLSGLTITPDPGDRPTQKITNNGAGTIAPGSNQGAYHLTVINAAGAGAITVSGWTKVDGAFDTTTTSKFWCSCIVCGDYSAISILKVV